MMNPLSIKLDFFKKLITDFVRNDFVEYSQAGQVIQKNYDTPWIQIELVRFYIDSLIESYHTTDTVNIPCEIIRMSLLMNIHVRSRKQNNFEAHYLATKLLSLFANPDFVSGMATAGLILALPDPETEDETIITCDSIEFDGRIESDIWFPISMGIAFKFEFNQLDTGWFERVLVSTNVDDWGDMNLDDEIMEGP